MTRIICERCKQIYFVVAGKIDGTERTEHICKDLEKRLKRQTKQVEAVRLILLDLEGEFDVDEIAYKIVQTLTHLQINMEDN